MSLSLQELSDRMEINDLLVRYTRAIDDMDWNLLDTVFTPDADIDYTSSGGIAGKYPEVREWLGKALAAFPITIHAITNSTVTLDGDTGKGTTLVNNPMVAPNPDGGQQQFTVWAWYVDEFVRTAEGWRISKRHEDQVLLEGALPTTLQIPE